MRIPLIIPDEKLYGYIKFFGSPAPSKLHSIKIDGSEIGQVALPNDNQELKIGASGDLRLYHNATDSYITNQTGNLNITAIILIRLFCAESFNNWFRR